MEQLVWERRVEEQRMRVEISQAKRQGEFFAEQVENGARIRRLEEKASLYFSLLYLPTGVKW